jgi:4-amino-4-deoxy-L-arabinose transferase-like glycosyltransferase
MSSIRAWKLDPFLIIITVLGGFLRMYRPGLLTIQYDEINVLFWTNRILESGDWIWVSNNPISWGSNFTPFTHHSPLTNYFFLLPAFLSDDPAFSRLYVGLLGTLSVVLLYLIAKHMFGCPAAVIAAAAYAASPLAVEWARLVWNPSIAPLMVVGWIGALLFGYRNGIRWLRWVSWVLLALLIQAHPAHVLLGLSALIAVLIVLSKRSTRRPVLVDTMIGGVLAALTFLPWIYGTFFFSGPIQSFGTSGAANLPPAPDTLVSWFEQFGRLTSATTYRMIARGSLTIAPGNWWPDPQIELILIVYALIATLSLAVVTLRSLGNLRQRWPALFVASTGYLPLLVANLISRAEIQDFYLYAILPGVYLSSGIAAGWVLARWKRTKPVIVVAVAVFVALQSWLTVSMLRNFDFDGWEQQLRANRNASGAHYGLDPGDRRCAADC